MYLWNLVNLLGRPFGVDFNEWDTSKGSWPLLSYSEAIMGFLLYLAVTFGGQRFMKNRSPIRINWLFQFHNLFLIFSSSILLLLCLEQMYPFLMEGFFTTICAHKSWTSAISVLFYWNYILKYIEFLDTIFLVMKKKKLLPLHVYHHPMTMLLCYVQLHGQTICSWVPITLNLSVHIVMYYYYYLSGRGIRVGWKQLVTQLQIIQFVLDLIVVFFCTYNVITYRLFPFLPNMGDCRGTIFSGVFGFAVLTSYLILFVMFFRNTYKSKPKRQ